MSASSSDAVLILGAGPAGLAAANAILQSGKKVILVDENPAPGGQIWRSSPQAPLEDPEAIEAMARLSNPNLVHYRSSRWIMESSPGQHVLESPQGTTLVTANKVILCTGARERFLPFPGWTLPGVMGAGALQALVKMGLDIKGKRIVLAGSGPLLLAVADLIQKKGAHLLFIAEQTSRPRLAGFGTQLLRHPKKLKQALHLKRDLKGIPYQPNAWPLRAEGTHRLETVFFKTARGPMRFACDMLGCGFHLIPNLETALALGCETSPAGIRVNDALETSRPGIYAVGEAIGIGGLECARIEGTMAGLHAAGNGETARALQKTRHKERQFAAAMNRAFALRKELRALPDPETVLCRCEDIRYKDLCNLPDWRTAKIHTRCGMGACQGRICGAINQFLFQWTLPASRPPAGAAKLKTLATGFSTVHHPSNQLEPGE